MVLYSRRARDRETAEREANGESLWSEEFDARALQRIVTLWDLIEGRQIKQAWEVRESVASVMRLEGGWSVGDMVGSGFVLTHSRVGGIPFLLDLLETGHHVMSNGRDDFQCYLNVILNEHRIAFQMVEGQMIAKSSDELHVEVVEPALRLLVGSQYESAHDACLAALKEVTGGEPANAITDAGTALQETFSALGWSGHSLGRQIADARKNGLLLAGHDQQLVDGILKFADWASADRSETGDAHKHSDATRADAWLMVHVVGALIVRLVDPSRNRGE